MQSEQANSPDLNTATEKCQTRTKFGTRYLTDPQNVFQHNAWDNAVWDEEQEASAYEIATNHVKYAASSDKREEFEREAAKNWDQFYNIHTNRFFKDRHWLFTEFPELYGQDAHLNIISANIETLDSIDHCAILANYKEESCAENINCSESTEDSSLNNIKPEHSNIHSCECNSVDHMANLQISHDSNPSFKLLEVGCGVGNTVFPLLKTNKNPNLFVYCCDFSSNAIDIVKSHPDYDQKRCHAFVHDITADNSDVPFAPESLDVIIMIFVLSAVCPTKMQNAVNRLALFLKPGGIFLFRDYGRYDMAQLRFKEGRCLSENFYVRGDGTRVYFFTQEELRTMFQKAGLQEKENIIDRRLQVNRGRQLKMYRVWIQCKYIKPFL